MASSHRLQVILNHMNGPLNPSVKRTSTNKYLCTLDNTILTLEQRDFYEENGYIIIRNIIEDDLLEQFKIRFIDICNGKVEMGKMALLRDKSLKNIAAGEYLYNKATDLLWDDVFVKYCTHPKLLDYISCFIGPDITAIHSMFINKPPDSGKLTSTHPLHQDLHYFPVRPVEKVVGSWTALEKTTRQNGCLHVVPGSHRSILQYHGYPEYDVNYGFHGVRGFEDAPKVYLEMEKGDTVFLHPLILHGSGPNLTKGFRKAISCHYASSHCHFVDVTNTSQELIAKEAEEMGKRVGYELSHLELLKLRNVLVRGNRGKLLEDQAES